MSQEITKEFSEMLAKSHYENFPVASVLLPKKARKDIFHVYTFARLNDDIADDPERSESEKMALLNHVDDDLRLKNKENPLIALILPVIDRWNLDVQNFHDLISAFKQDAQKSEYETFDDILDYCKRSANPVGRLMLQFFDQYHEENVKYSDMICTGLQLINFWQDLSVDKAMKRFYVPKQILAKHQLDIQSFYFESPDQRHDDVIKEIIMKTESIYTEGKKLTKLLKGRLKYEIILIWNSAHRVLKKSKQLKSQLLTQRPTK